MKTLFLNFCFTLIVSISYAQTSHVEFTYDAAGNRTSRIIVLDEINETDSLYSDTNSIAESKIQEDGSSSMLFSDQIITCNLQQNKLFTLQVFPNPTYGKLNINFSGSMVHNSLQLAVVNENGNLLFTRDLLSNSNIVDLSKQPAGIYYIQILSEGKKIKDYKVVKV